MTRPAPRTLLVQPPYGEPKMEPNGLLYLASWLRHNGYPAELMYESGLSRFGVPEVVRRVEAEAYDVVGVSTLTPALPLALSILRAAKQRRPDSLTVMGGYHATVAHRHVLEKYPWVDVVVRGEGEETLLELVRRLERGEGFEGLLGISYRDQHGVHDNPLRELSRSLDELPFPERRLGPGPEEYAHFYDPAAGFRVTANVTSSRGCPYSCAFCVLGSDPPGSPISYRRWRTRSVRNVCDEIEHLRERYGVSAIAFAEDNFSVSPQRLDEFADELLRRELDVVFRFTARAGQVVRFAELLPKLRRAGLRKIEMGIESASPRVLERYAKGSRVEDNVEALRLLARHDIEPRIDFIMFDALTTVEDLELNARFLRQHAPPHYNHNRTTCQRLELHPGTELQRQYLEQGLTSGDPDEVLPWSFVQPEVGLIFELLDGFYWSHQTRLDQLMARIHRYQIVLNERLGRGADQRAVLNDLVFLTIPCHGLPLKLFEAVLARARESGCERSELQTVVDHHRRRVEQLEREFDEVVKRHEPRVGHWQFEAQPSDHARV